jgi:hypothetical protein
MHAPQRRKADKAVKGGSHPAKQRPTGVIGTLQQKVIILWLVLHRYGFTGICMRHWKLGIFSIEYWLKLGVVLRIENEK